MTASSLDSTYAPVTGARNLWPLLPAGMAVFGASALVFYHTHPDLVSTPPSALQSLVIGVYATLGFAPGFMLAVLLLSWSSVWWFTSRIERIGARAVRLLAFTIALAVLINLRETAAQPHTGALGWWVAERLASLFGATVSTILMAPLAVGSLILATDGFFYRYFEGMTRPDDAAPEAEPARSASPAGPEVGVETEATEHLKSLAATTLAPSLGATPGAPVAFADVEAEVLASLQEPPPVVPADERAVAEAEPMRRSSRRSRWYDEGPIPSEPAAAVALRDEPAATPVEAPVAAAEPVPASTDVVEDEFAVAAESMTEAEMSTSTEPVQPWVEVPQADVPLAEVAADAPADEGFVVLPRRGHLAPIVDAMAEEDDPDQATEPAVLLDRGPRVEAPEHEPAPSVEVSEATEAPTGGGDEPGAAIFADAATPWADASSVVAPAASAEAKAEAADGEAESATAATLSTENEVAAGDEPVVAIPRPPEGIRQQRLFVSGFDEQLIQDAIDLVTSSRRASATHLQRKLRIEFDQAMELLALLGRRGVIEIADGETQGRVVGS